MLGGAGIGAGDQLTVGGVGRARRPHLLAVDDPLVAVALRPAGQVGQVAARPRLAEELAGEQFGPPQRSQEPGLLPGGAEGGHGRGHQPDRDARQLGAGGRVEAGLLLGVGPGVLGRQPGAAPLLRPGGDGVAGVVLGLLPGGAGPQDRRLLGERQVVEHGHGVRALAPALAGAGAGGRAGPGVGFEPLPGGLAPGVEIGTGVVGHRSILAPPAHRLRTVQALIPGAP